MTLASDRSEQGHGGGILQDLGVLPVTACHQEDRNQRISANAPAHRAMVNKFKAPVSHEIPIILLLGRECFGLICAASFAMRCV